MTGDHPSESFSADPLHRLMDRERDAYAHAREVIDRYPAGPIDRDALPDRDRALLDDWSRAESAVKRLRAERRELRAAKLRQHPPGERR